MLNIQKSIWIFLILVLVSACETTSRNVVLRSDPVPDVHHLVMKGQIQTSLQDNVVQFMLIGFRQEAGFTEVVLGWHVLQQRTVSMELVFTGFTIRVGERTIRSIRCGSPGKVSENQAGSIRIRFPEMRDLDKTPVFDLIEQTPDGVIGLRFIGCRFLGGKKDE